MEFSKVLNITVGCIMASRLEMKEKREVIDSLRSLESEFERLKIVEQSYEAYLKSR